MAKEYLLTIRLRLICKLALVLSSKDILLPSIDIVGDRFSFFLKKSNIPIIILN